MRIAGHTLGTPDLAIDEALRLFAHLDLDGAEIIWQDGYRSAIPESDDAEARRVGIVAADLGLEIACLTPYMSGINSLDDAERHRDIDRFRHCIAVAAELGVPAIRVYAGAYDPVTEARVRWGKWARLVAALQVLGERAIDHGVTLCVENHFSTMAVSAAETAHLVGMVGSPAVGILYDQANLSFTHCEPFERAIPLQRRWIRHVQAKDFEFVDPDRPFSASAVHAVAAAERTIRSRPVGAGILDWAGIVGALRGAGYDGFLSLEYEYRWHPDDLPDPRTGFAAGARRLRAIIARLDGAT